MKTIEIIFLNECYQLEGSSYLYALDFFNGNSYVKNILDKFVTKLKIKDIEDIFSEKEKKRNDLKINKKAISFYNRFMKYHEVIYEKENRIYLSYDNDDSWLLRILSRLKNEVVIRDCCENKLFVA